MFHVCVHLQTGVCCIQCPGFQYFTIAPCKARKLVLNEYIFQKNKVLGRRNEKETILLKLNIHN